MEDKDQPIPEQSNKEDLKEVEELMGPMPEFPQAGLDLQKITAAKHKASENAAAKGHGFRKKSANKPPSKQSKKSKITVSFGDEAEDAPKKDATQENTAESEDANTSKPKKKGIVVTDFADNDDSTEPTSAESTVTGTEVSANKITVTEVSDDQETSRPKPLSKQITIVDSTAEEASESSPELSSDSDSDSDSESDTPSAPPLPKNETPGPPKPSPKPPLVKPVPPVAKQPVVPPVTPPRPVTTPLVTTAKPVTKPELRPEITRLPQAAQKQNVPPQQIPLPPNPRAPLQPQPTVPPAFKQVQKIPPQQIPRVQPPQNTAPVRPVSPPAVQKPAFTPKPIPVAPRLQPQPPASSQPAPSMRPVAPRQPIMNTASVKKPRKSILKAPAFRGFIALLIIAGVLGVGLVPSTRYPILNIAGVRVATSLVVLDDKTSLPLKNVSVAIKDKEMKTDDDGKVSFDGLELGKHTIVIKKIGFDTLNRNVVLGWGSNPLGEYKMNAVGAQYQFVVKDWLSQKPISKAEVISGDSSAFTDANGLALLTVEKETEGDMEITIRADGFRTEKKVVDAQDKTENHQELVPSKQHYFVSKRTGKYNIYKSDIDGKNEELVIDGTGLETEDIKLIPHPTKQVAALIASRENVRNKDGFLNSGLYVVDFAAKELEKITQSEKIEMISWMGDNLVYAKIADGASNTDPQRHRLMSYDIEAASDKEIAASNYFNDVLAADGFIYYAPSNAFQDNPNAQLYRVKPDGSEQISIVNKEVWNLFRTSYESVDVMQHQEWYKFNIGDTLATKQTVAPVNPKHRIYVDSPSGKQALWIDERDGQGVILQYDIEKKQDTVVYAQAGLTYPIRWLNDDYIIFRVASGTESADYVMYVGGKDAPIKIQDVSNSPYIGRWYYY